MARKMFVNVAVEDLDRSVEFFTKLGFSFDPRFTNETATCMIVSDEAFVMLLVESKFKAFTTKELADTTTQTEAILALSAESREQVDELADMALEAGGASANDPIDWVSCMDGASRTSTVTSGSSSGWTRVRWSSRPATTRTRAATRRAGRRSRCRGRT